MPVPPITPAERDRAVFDHIDHGVVVLDPAGRVLDINRAALNYVDLPLAAILGQPFWEGAGRVADDPAQAERIRAAVLAAARGETIRIESSVLPADRPRPMHTVLTLRPVFGADRKTVRMIIAEGHDTTRRREHEAALSLGSARLELAVEVAGINIFEHDHETDLVTWLFGDGSAATRGGGRQVSLRAVLADLLPEERADIEASIARSHDPAGDGRHMMDHRIITPAGDIRWVSIRTQTFFGGPEEARRPVRTVGASLDITDRVHAETRLRELNATLEQRVELRTRELREALDTLRFAQEELVRSEKLAALGALVAGVAHELNTPIGNALMVASTLLDKTDGVVAAVQEGTLRRSELDAYLRVNGDAARLLMDNLRRAADLVCDFKQVAVDQASDKRRSFDLADVVTEVLSTVRFLAARGIDVRLDLAAGITMDSFPGPLGQVINNFFSNAVDHAFDGRGQGLITIRTVRRGERQVVLTFADDGRGIEPEHLPRLFDPFFTTRLGRGGSGLGLNIVHTIVTAVLGGSISVSSTPGRGTCFEVVLPLDAPQADHSPTAAGRAPAAPGDAAG